MLFLDQVWPLEGCVFAPHQLGLPWAVFQFYASLTFTVKLKLCLLSVMLFSTWNSLSHVRIFQNLVKVPLSWSFLSSILSFLYISHLFKVVRLSECQGLALRGESWYQEKEKIAVSWPQVCCISSPCREWTCSLFCSRGTSSYHCCPETSQILAVNGKGAWGFSGVK